MQDNDIDKLHDYANTQNNYDVFRANNWFKRIFNFIANYVKKKNMIRALFT